MGNFRLARKTAGYRFAQISRGKPLPACAARGTLMRRRRHSLSGAWFDLARSSIELMQGSASVIATRTTAMAEATVNPSATHDREMRRMVEEKVEASAASLTNMLFSTAASCQSMFFASVLGGHAPNASQAERAITKALGAGMAPYQKAVRSNLKRLRK